MLVQRMIRAAMLEAGLYEEVERDLNATTQALTVVVIVSLASGLSGAIAALLSLNPAQAVGGLVGGIISAIVGWVVWSVIVYFIGTSVFGGAATPGEVMRTIGFAYTPNVLAIFGFVWVIGGLVVFIGAIWSLVAGVVAVRQALDFDTTKAVLTVVLGWIAMIVVAAVLALFGLGLSFMRPF